MSQALWIAKTGLDAQQTRMAVISNNLANVNTTGFKRGRAVFEGWQKTIPGSELAILPIDGYHAAGTDPDNTARVTLDFIARHS